VVKRTQGKPSLAGKGLKTDKLHKKVGVGQVNLNTEEESTGGASEEKERKKRNENCTARNTKKNTRKRKPKERRKASHRVEGSRTGVIGKGTRQKIMKFGRAENRKDPGQQGGGV